MYFSHESIIYYILFDFYLVTWFILSDIHKCFYEEEQSGLSGLTNLVPTD